MMWPRRRFGRRNPQRMLIALAILVAIVAARGILPLDEPRVFDPADGAIHRVERVVDGDTLLIEGRVRVRLIGVDTPETVKPDHPVEPWGPEATAFTESFVRQGAVRLTYDRERLDQYGRTLAYVWVDDRLLNEELIRAGLGRAMLQYPYSSDMKQRFRQAQEAARRERLGIWSGAEPPSNNPVSRTGAAR